MHRTTAALTLALTLAAPAAAAPAASHAADAHFCGRPTPHPIDTRLAIAAQRSGGVTVDLADAQSAAWEAWDKELNRTYAALLRKAAATGRGDALRAAQRAWLAYDRAESQWKAALHADEGTSTALNVQGASLARRRARVCDLQNDLEGLE